MSDEALRSSDSLHPDDETDRLALAAVEAIKRLLSERNALRQEVRRLSSHIVFFRNSYRRLANELVTQLELIERLDVEPQGTGGFIKFPRFLGSVPPKSTQG
jgi:hypothetical protein